MFCQFTRNVEKYKKEGNMLMSDAVGEVGLTMYWCGCLVIKYMSEFKAQTGQCVYTVAFFCCQLFSTVHNESHMHWN